MNKLFEKEYKIGFSKEKELITLLNKLNNKNLTIEESTQSEDIYDHIDFKINKTYNIDVKSLKKKQRSDTNFQEEEHFVEIKNVNGNTGWAYSQKTDFFAFETFDYWLFVSKEKLQNLVKEKVEKVFVDDVYNCLYKLYSRPNRKDIITKVKTIDLMAISDEIIKK